MADQHLGQWYLIPTAKVVASLTDGDFFLVRASDVTLVDSNSVTTSTPMRPSTPYINDDTASSAPQGSRCVPRRRGVAAPDALLPPPSDPGSSTNNTHAPHPTPGPPPMIRSRPQAGNNQSYFTMLHTWAGRSAGGFGRPMAGRLGNGSWGKWSHRAICSVCDDVTLGSEVKRYIFDNYDDASTELFQRWLTERNLNNYATENARAPQFSELMDSGTPSTHRNTCASHYYQVPLSDLEGEWVRAYHGTYFYVRWSIFISGCLGSGLRGEGGDTHMVVAAPCRAAARAQRR